MFDISNARTQLLGSSQLLEKFNDGGIFGMGREIFRVDRSSANWIVGIFSDQFIAIDSQSRWRRIGKFTVNEHICHHFPENFFPQIDPNIALQVKFVLQVGSNEQHELIVRIDQIGANLSAVIIVIQVFPSQQRIGLVKGQNLLDHLIFSKQQRRRQGIALFACFIIFFIKASNG